MNNQHESEANKMYVCTIVGPIMRLGGIDNSPNPRFLAFTVDPYMASHGTTEKEAINNLNDRIDNQLMKDGKTSEKMEYTIINDSKSVRYALNSIPLVNNGWSRAMDEIMKELIRIA